MFLDENKDNRWVYRPSMGSCWDSTSAEEDLKDRVKVNQLCDSDIKKPNNVVGCINRRVVSVVSHTVSLVSGSRIPGRIVQFGHHTFKKAVDSLGSIQGEQ